MTIETFTIFPTHKYNINNDIKNNNILLHGLDKLQPPIQIHNHRFFNMYITINDFTNIIESLKNSLSIALEYYPPMNGTLVTDDTKTGDIYISLSDIIGTPFIVDIKDEPFIKDDENLSPRTDIILPSTASMFAVKVTKFSCNTICVASSFNHQVADLRGFFDFLELWAKISRGESIDLKQLPDDWSHNPNKFFSSINLPVSTPTYPEPFEVLPTPVIGPPEYLLQPSEVSRWKITKNSLEQLKIDFSPPKNNDKQEWISSGDALVSLISGVITRAREQSKVKRFGGRSSVESNVEKIAMAADGRERAPLGNMINGKYFGNFNNLWSKTVSRSDLLETSNEAGSRIALAIRNGLNESLSATSIANRLSFFESEENAKPPGRINWSADIILTNWSRINLGGPQLEFGWGKLFNSTSGGVTSYPPGYSIISLDKESGDTTILLTIEKIGFDILKSDSLLNKYATLL